MLLQTPLHDSHVALGARMVDFGGWSMPLHYGSQLDEHAAVRQHAGLFDVSHMRVVDLDGAEARAALRWLLANDVDRLAPGQALYTCMLNEAGGIVDDLIVYARDAGRFRLVINAATAATDVEWMQAHSKQFDVSLRVRETFGILALQGPAARALCGEVFGDLSSVKRFYSLDKSDEFLGRTGYTGEDGFEIVVAGEQLTQTWETFLAAGAKPCGLGARDSLRLEAGLNLYGQDMDTAHTPYSSNVGWTVALGDERPFIGRGALEAERAVGAAEKLVGVVLDGRGIMRHGQRITTESEDGVVTSGGFSPTLNRSIALARVPAETGDSVNVIIRNKPLPATIVQPPFVKAGKATF